MKILGSQETATAGFELSLGKETATRHAKKNMILWAMVFSRLRHPQGPEREKPLPFQGGAMRGPRIQDTPHLKVYGHSHLLEQMPRQLVLP